MSVSQQKWPGLPRASRNASTINRNMPVSLWLLRRPAIGPAPHPVSLGYSRPFILLTCLALHGDWLTREYLAALFWPEATEAAARRNLRRLVSRLPEIPGAHSAEVEPDRLRWLIKTDVAAFRTAIGHGQWSTAVRLHRQQLLPGFEPADEGIRTWLETERNTLFAAFCDAATEHIRDLASQGRHAEAAQLAKQVTDADPYAEDFVRLHMEQAFLSGRRHESNEVFRQFSELLREELELDPEPETVRLHDRLNNDAAPAPEQTRPGSVPEILLKTAPLAGREAELAELRQSPVPVLMSAEPGAGKTRLLREILPDDGLYCRGLEGLEHVPFHPLIRLIRRQLAEGTPVPGDPVRLATLARLIPELGRAPEETADPATETARLHDALAGHFRDTCSMLIFDDLQWADAGTLDFISFLLADGKLPIAGAFRSTEMSRELAGLLDNAGASLRQLALKPLSSEGISELLMRLTGRATPPPLFADWLLKLSGGNPLFALETLRSLFEARILRYTANDWSTTVDDLTRDYSELPTPAAVRDVIQRRLGQLGGAARRTLDAAAVLGDYSTRARVSALTGLDGPALDGALAETAAAGFTDGLVFSHDLPRQVLLQTTPEATLQYLHRLAADTFSAPLLKAPQLAAAGETDLAVAAWFTACSDLMRRSLYREALTVLDAVTQADHSGTWWQAAQLRRANALRGLNRNDEALAAANGVLAASSSAEERAAAHEAAAGIMLGTGDLEGLAEHVQAGLALLDDRNSETWRNLEHLRINVLFHKGSIQEAGEAAERLVEQARREKEPAQLSALLTSLGAIREVQQRFEEALALHRESLDLARQLGSRLLEVTAVMNMLSTLIDLGRPEDGVSLAEEALQLGPFSVTDSLRANLAAACREAGDHARALFHYLWLAEHSSDPLLRCTAHVNLSRYAHAEGRHGDLKQHLRTARTDVQLVSYPVTRARVGVVLALYGGARELESARQLLENIDDGAMPPDLQSGLARARELL